MKKIAIALIKAYQKTLSPSTGFFNFIYSLSIFRISSALPIGCKYEKSCSQYSIESISSFGLLKGLRLSIVRVYNCR
ncbi:MAG: membrane protein insertion efficiency factor YidD [bacterium]|nr:membrane protein insertion efficiency factor YidD [bacterium]